MAAKTRATAVKRLSLLRLEVKGALTALRLIRFAQEALQLDIYSISCWGDSKVTLAWVWSATSCLKPLCGKDPTVGGACVLEALPWENSLLPPNEDRKPHDALLVSVLAHTTVQRHRKAVPDQRPLPALCEELPLLEIDADQVLRDLVGQRIQWKFIPPRAPWMKDYWERLIWTTKESLRKVLGQALLSDEELWTFLCEVDACLNARPLTLVEEATDELVPLSPFQLLTGRTYADLREVEDQHRNWHSPERRHGS
ncbi:hypothetical protein T07_12759 [Trichinella nelsoni]|uniref:Uncharacterized protein n=1 Tax=Trichinella nelsoni TaxID=6336 RepID=A0A0V0RVL6_9BILA|nr:hypothetical protein T07_12759 [Trichinella nelsoni]